MAYSLSEALQILKAHEAELRRRGVTRAAVFGSVARGEAGASSDVDILIDLDPGKPIGLFDYVCDQTLHRGAVRHRYAGWARST